MVDLPRLLLIADRFTLDKNREAVIAAVEAGVSWVQFRDHEATEKVFRQAAESLTDELRAINPNVLLSVNTHAKIAGAINGALHVGKRGPDVLDARLLTDHPLGYSAHSLPDGIVAKRHGADYITYSPIYRPRGKPNARPLGPRRLGLMCDAVKGFPVLALGGINPKRTRTCIKQGAHGVAVCSGILYVDQPGEAARAYLDVLKDN